MLGVESAVDQGSVPAQVVATSVSRIRNVIQINIVAGRQTQLRLRPGAGVERLVVLKLVLASYVARARTAGQPMNAVFLINVLIRVARDVQQTQTAVPDSIVVRKNSGTSLASVVRTVLENLVVQAMIVVAQARLVIRITDVRICLRINRRRRLRL